MMTLGELAEKANQILKERPDLKDEPVWFEFRDMDGFADLVVSESNTLYLTEEKEP